MDLEEQILVCLEIMIQADAEMPSIGHWVAALEEAEKRGLAAKVGGGYRITDAGVKFLEEEANAGNA